MTQHTVPAESSVPKSEGGSAVALLVVDRDNNPIGGESGALWTRWLMDASRSHIDPQAATCIRRVFDTGVPMLGVSMGPPEAPATCSFLPLKKDADGVSLVQILVSAGPATAPLAQSAPVTETAPVTVTAAEPDTVRGRLAAIVESARDAIISKSLDGTVQTWNRSAERILGYRAAEMIGSNITRIIPPDRLAEESHILGRIRRGEVIERYQTVRLHKDGYAIPVELTVSPVRDGNGVIVGASKILQDVTARQAAELALQRREEELEIITNGVPALISYVDRDLCYRFNNREYERWFGVDPGSIYGRHMRDVLGDSAFEAIRPYAERALAGEAVRFETLAEYRGGGKRYIDASYLPRRDADGRVEGMFVLVSDVTARKTAEKALQDSEARFRFMTETMPDSVLTADAEGACTYANARWYDFTGAEPGSALGNGWLDFVHEEDRTRVQTAWDAAVQDGHPFECKYRLRGADGCFRWTIARSQRFEQADGGATPHWLGVCTDIDDLVQAQEALKTSHQRKDEFLAMLAHELRNPLAPIVNALEVIRLQPDPAAGKADWAVEVIARQTAHLTHLVDDLLDIARIVSGRIQLRREIVDLRSLARQAIENAEARMTEKHLTFTQSVTDAPLYVHADGSRIMQILDNLLDNAAKYTDAGGSVILTVERRDDVASICVRDTGIGIAPQDQQRVFDLFEQASSGLDRSRGGLGLGLNLVQRLVEMHDGTVGVSSRGAQQGSEFVVRLPLAAPAESAAPRNVPAIATPKRRVLVIEDNLDVAAALGTLLEALGHEALTVADGPTGLARVAGYRPHLILVDLGLPGMNGYEVGAALRARYPAGSVLLVALTGYGRAADRARSAAAGFDRHVIKPMRRETLGELLQQAPVTAPDRAPDG
jgi:PAS domain S-box-containing protein